MDVALPVVAGVLAATSTGAGVAALATTRDRTIGRRLAGLSARPLAEIAPARRALRRAATSRIISKRRPSDVESLLSAAGGTLSPEEIRAAQMLGATSALILGAIALLVVPSAWPLLPIFTLVGHRGPRMLLVRAAQRRRAAANREVPQFLDLLAAASTAGLGPHGALERAVGATSGPLEQELRRFLAEVQLGARWRDGLIRLADRLGLSDLRRAVQAMIRTERLGSSLSEALRDLADEVREERRSAATERARKAPVKMLFPLVFMILPAFLLLTVVPVLISTLRSIR
jgi:tight adherence protein C